jgi:5-methyltetrahydropteroyltriglutamate--homocysteine methyltransferase
LTGRARRQNPGFYLNLRIAEASHYIKLEQLGLSPQCGFATGAAEHVTVTEEVEQAKLARIVEVARAVWGSAPRVRG